MKRSQLAGAHVTRQRKLGPEAANGYARRLAEGFFARYLSGAAVLDIGFRGGHAEGEPITEQAIGIELDYPGYDGTHLPFEAESQDAVFASHTLEHIVDYKATLADWYRVLKIGGTMIIIVPHKQLYERKARLPSRFNSDHKRFYTPASLMAEIEQSLPVGGYRVRSLKDIDEGFNYDLPPEVAPVGSYEIELIVEKIVIPKYAARLAELSDTETAVKKFAALLKKAGVTGAAEDLETSLAKLALPPFCRLAPYLPAQWERTAIRDVLRRQVERAPFDEQFYVAKNPDIAAAVAAGAIRSGKAHFIEFGYFENRAGSPDPSPFD